MILELAALLFIQKAEVPPVPTECVRHEQVVERLQGLTLQMTLQGADAISFSREAERRFRVPAEGIDIIEVFGNPQAPDAVFVVAYVNGCVRASGVLPRDVFDSLRQPNTVVR